VARQGDQPHAVIRAAGRIGIEASAASGGDDANRPSTATIVAPVCLGVAKVEVKFSNV
jgi:hypothetical protein